MSLVPFRYDGQPVRVVDIDGEPWFVLADLCRVLGITRPPSAVAERIDEALRRAYPIAEQIETRRLAVKLSRCENSRTGEEFAAHTVRITAKGAVALAVMLNVAPADLAEALTTLDEEATA